MPKERYQSLDSLRGIASVIVVIHHCMITFPVFWNAHFHKPQSNIIVNIISNSPLHILWGGHECVLLFFVLSGFVLAIPFLRTDTSPLHNYKQFVIKRICRIYLPYIAAMALSIVFIFMFSSLGDQRLKETFNGIIPIKSIISYILMLGYNIDNVNGATWSLVHEMRISLIFPLLMLLILKRNWIKNTLYILGTFLFLFVGFKFASIKINDAMMRFVLDICSLTFYYGLFFVFGALLAKFRLQIQKFILQFKVNLRVLFLVLGLCLFSIEWLIPSIGYAKYNSPVVLGFIFNILIDMSIAFGSGIILIMSITSFKMEKFLERPCFVFLGGISYSLYLIHPIIVPVVVSTISKRISPIIAILFVPLFSVLISILFNKYIEKPSIILGKKLVSTKYFHFTKNSKSA